jgi:hypothetical protein
MKNLKSIRSTLVTIAIVCICARVAWYAIEPVVVAIVPYLVMGALLITVIAIALFRTTRL